ncbi:hypothetical protein [Desulfosporosinus hippei]|uniref:Uncharacterized protein n=1 Tax=Desulfosporosinus hippei DSM 8344 TaxID=1121419 RepID=A0A1G7YVC8_9FIRM|nr:hypothetical protein [Desulfosporosinus hippei]SDH00468.1 hypothetical protein SAMN05443529_108167 [Desulfosporosinus hippei DSM 8344]
MKKRIIFPLMFCLFVLFSSDVFAAQKTKVTDIDLISQGTNQKSDTQNIITPDHVVLSTGRSDIWQNYGYVGGQGYTQCWGGIAEVMRAITYIYEGNTIVSHDEQLAYNTQSLYSLPTSVPYDSSKTYKCASNHFVTHDGVLATIYSYEDLE